MAQLTVVSPDGAERTVPLAGKAVSVGRADECDVVLEEQKASRRHCRVEPRGASWRLVDEGSSNGTFLGGRPVLAVRLKPGDEIGIGETVITFEDDGDAAAAQVRRPKVKKKPTPWGALAIPVIALIVAFVLVSKFDASEGGNTSTSLARFAQAEIDRAAFLKDAQMRRSAVADARSVLEKLRNSDEALALLDAADAAAAGPAPAGGGIRSSDWRPALEDLAAEKSLSLKERRARLSDLLERHLDDAEAVTAIRARVRVELTAPGERDAKDREQTFTDAEAAAADGRYGAALELWTSWLKRTPAISPDDDRLISQRLTEILAKSYALAQEAAAQYEEARRAGRDQAAVSAIESAMARLDGTGYDVWLAARASRGGTVVSQPGAKPADKQDDASARERARGLQISGQGESLARERRFAEAAAKLDEAAGAVTDKQMKGYFALRAGDLRTVAAYWDKLVGWVVADAKKFSPVTIGDHKVVVLGASATELQLAGAGGAPDPQTFAELHSFLFEQLVDKADMDKADFVAAALFLKELGEANAYTRWMRAALGVEEMRLAASEVHARSLGQPPPEGGYMPHPRDRKSIVTLREYKAILNEEEIKRQTGELAKLVDKIEKSKQAKSVETVRRAYVKLEDARNAALKLIFDEVKYFYPYRDRMKDYAPVQHEVDELVKAVRDAWDDTTKAKITSDQAFDKLVADAEHLVTEIQFLGGVTDELVDRANKVRMYIGKDLNVRTFFENQADQDLYAYNAKVLKYNPLVKGPTEPERKQVEITNDYRIMFGHRRAVRIQPMLVNSARGHSEDMSKLGFFDHFNPFNPEKHSPFDRMKLAGYEGAGSSENIYMGSGSPEAAHAGWIHSSGHHRNILTPAWLEMGSGQSGSHWTQNFGFRTDDDWDGGPPK